MQPYIWPKEGQFNMETRADKPGPPGVPIARGIGKALFEVTWDKAEENGAAVDSYSLECLIKFSPEAENITIFTLEEQEQQQHRHKRASEKLEMAEKFVASESTASVTRRKPNQMHWFEVYNGTAKLTILIRRY